MVVIPAMAANIQQSPMGLGNVFGFSFYSPPVHHYKPAPNIITEHANLKMWSLQNLFQWLCNKYTLDIQGKKATIYFHCACLFVETTAKGLNNN